MLGPLTFVPKTKSGFETRATGRSCHSDCTVQSGCATLSGPYNFLVNLDVETQK